ncbi:MAG: hypothetical protein N2652_01210 [Kiritimatiellae bacterium]|nr:hypothetical protein [Kiritimatiellia bacterium]
MSDRRLFCLLCFAAVACWVGRAFGAVQQGGAYAIEQATVAMSSTPIPSGAGNCQVLAVLGQEGGIGESATGAGVEVAWGILAIRPAWDTDGDGQPDDEDPDLDDDGWANAIDALPYDTDNDGLNNVVDEDDDNDVLTDLEEGELGTNALRPDTDGDGFDDGTEVRVLGTDPRQAGDHLRCADVRISGGRALVTWRASPGIVYRLQRSHGLAPGRWSDVSGPVVGSGLLLTVTDSVPTAAAFWRVRVSAGAP